MKNVSVLERLNMELVNCMNDGKTVKVHFLFNGSFVRNTIIPNEVEMDENGIYITADRDFEMEIGEDVKEIQYDELENSYCVQVGELETYFDF